MSPAKVPVPESLKNVNEIGGHDPPRKAAASVAVPIRIDALIANQWLGTASVAIR
jgi:hypothetical protein